MAYDEQLAQRTRSALATRRGITERKLFGGLAFMLHGNMCCGIVGDRLMARVGPEAYEEALARPHAREMDFNGRPMRGMVYVEPAGVRSDRDLARWVARAVAFVETLPAK
jgi:TfoX/Sxy family transcriptional regulator of competence genes